jgi:hypothetical protein
MPWNIYTLHTYPWELPKQNVLRAMCASQKNIYSCIHSHTTTFSYICLGTGVRYTLRIPLPGDLPSSWTHMITENMHAYTPCAWASMHIHRVPELPCLGDSRLALLVDKYSWYTLPSDSHTTTFSYLCLVTAVLPAWWTATPWHVHHCTCAQLHNYVCQRDNSLYHTLKNNNVDSVSYPEGRECSSLKGVSQLYGWSRTWLTYIMKRLVFLFV